ncbi:MAG TPA: citrate/2-methylcitrate synthase, partial [Pyrinomonadaceae bacterium]
MAETVKDPPSATPSSTGLRGVVVGASTVSDVVGDKGQLIYQGYDIHDLAKHSNFEEVAFLLWNKRLPKQTELDDLRRAIGASYRVPHEVIEVLRQAPADADPIDVLRTGTSALEFYDPKARDISLEASRQTSIKLTAQFPTLVAAADRLRRGLEPVEPLPHENIATNFLYMLKGERPSAEDAKLFDVCLVLHADHELNASTFTARVVAGTLATVYASVVAAIGAL